MPHRPIVSRSLYALCRVGLECAAVAAGSYMAFLIRFDGNIPASYLRLWETVLPALAAVRIAAIYVMTQYRRDWRFTGVSDVYLVGMATVAGSGAFWLLLRTLGVPGFSPGLLLLDAFLNLNLALGIRVGTRSASWLSKELQQRRTPGGRRPKRVLVIGAGVGGHRIVRAMKENPAGGLRAIGFLDDDPAKRWLNVQGSQVLGTIGDLPRVVRRYNVDQILVAIPTISGRRLKDVVELAEGTPAVLTIVPTLPQLVNGARNATRAIRGISVEDLLERTPVKMNCDAISEYVEGRCVMVTGAGGSIGSELCRQIVAFKPSKLILVGQGEHSIFWIENELRTEHGYQAIPVIADIKDRVKLEAVFRDHQPYAVFHAAAHKHVPLMEANPEEAIKNNVFGTRNVAELSVQHNVRKFVMISTDKAVNPTSVMGATKRVAEMMMQSLAQRVEAARNGDEVNAKRHLNGFHNDSPVTELSAVRFGNVLGSRGSVIPTMSKQIEKGGPVTVTDAEMVRFFMTIPEAAQLVLQAGALPDSGRIYVLDMGKPVRILDLARNLIRLSGFVPDKDIHIEITGMRPGEKLYEEVLTSEEGVTATTHDKILVARPTHIDVEALYGHMSRLELLALRGDGPAIRDALGCIVPTYSGGKPGPPTVETPKPPRETPKQTEPAPWHPNLS